MTPILAGLIGTGLGWGISKWKKPKKKRRARSMLAAQNVLPVVGTGWVWPHRDHFPTQAAIAGALTQLGYQGLEGAGTDEWSFFGEPQTDAVFKFQADYNLVDIAYNAARGEVSISGRIDAPTLEAILAAQRYVAKGSVWRDVVNAAAQVIIMGGGGGG